MEQPSFKDILQKIQSIEEEYSSLLKKPLSPEGAWIHEYTVSRVYINTGVKHEYRYAKWHSQEPIFLRNPKKKALPLRKGKDKKYTCHQHIGRVSSTSGLPTDPEVLEAYESLANRKRLEKIQSAIQEISEVLNDLCDR